MSTGQVVSPISDMSAHRRPFARAPPTVPGDRSRARRQLWQVDHEENRRFLEREMARMARRDVQKYNFEFQAGLPLPGPLQWVPVNARTERVSANYALRRLPYLESHAAAPRPQEATTSAASAAAGTATAPSAASCSKVAAADDSSPPVLGNISNNSSSSSGSESSFSSCSSSSSGGTYSLATSAQPAEESSEEQAHHTTATPSKNTRQRQAVITEFMPQRKRTASSMSKEPSSEPRSKVPKTTS